LFENFPYHLVNVRGTNSSETASEEAHRKGDRES